MVQRLRLCAPNARDPDSIPGQGAGPQVMQLKILHAAVKVRDPHVPQLRPGAAK